jgi:hypothetical protein
MCMGSRVTREYPMDGVAENRAAIPQASNCSLGTLQNSLTRRGTGQCWDAEGVST